MYIIFVDCNVDRKKTNNISVDAPFPPAPVNVLRKYRTQLITAQKGRLAPVLKSIIFRSAPNAKLPFLSANLSWGIHSLYGGVAKMGTAQHISNYLSATYPD